MIRILVVGSQRTDFQNIERQLNDQQKLTFQYLETLSKSALNDIEFELILIAHSFCRSDPILLLEKVLKLKLASPAIYLTNANESVIDHQVMRLGADDCLPIENLTSSLFTRTIQHAIHRKQTESDFARLATHDQLTGLANRYLLYQHLEHSVSLARRSKESFAVLFIDLDNFKRFNDSLGHDVGDRLLISVAERITTCVRETDIVARYGNDEFAILLENTGASRNVALITEKIHSVLELAFEVRDHELFVSASIGIATFPECGADPETLLKCADSALYKAKEMGPKQYYFYTSDLNKQARFKLELEKNLRRALINQEFAIHLQPQICSVTEKVAGAEALLRWQHPKYGAISPVIFIPLLDQMGLLVGVESWVLNQICQLGKRLTDIYGNLRFSVNISGSHFKAGNLKENIYLALQASSLDAENLEVELTEDIMIEHVEHNSRLLNELKSLGISIALDDFGKGYSSLSYLKNFPANILKIDKAFIDHVVDDKRDSAIVAMMINLSHQLGLKVVAEGVEHKEQLIQLCKYGCDYIQGYYFAKPMSIIEFEKFMANRSKNFSNTYQQTSPSAR